MSALVRRTAARYSPTRCLLWAATEGGGCGPSGKHAATDLMTAVSPDDRERVWPLPENTLVERSALGLLRVRRNPTVLP